MMHSTSSTSNHSVDHTYPSSNQTSALNNNPAINSSLKHQQQLHPSINPSSQPQKTSSTTSGSIISNPPTTINSTTQSTPAAQDTDNQLTGDSIKNPVIQAIYLSSSAPILPISCVQNQALHHSSSPSSASSSPLSASATTTTKITDTKLTSTFNNQIACHHNPPPLSSNNQSSSSSSLPPSSESSSSSVATATAPIAAATLPRLVTIQSILSQHSNQPDSALAYLVKDFNHLLIQLSEVQSTLAEAGDETGRLKSPNAVDSQASYAINQSIISSQRSPTEANTPKLAVNAQNSSNSSALLPLHTVDLLYTTQSSTRRQMLTPSVIPPESDPERKGAKASWVVEKFYSDVLALDHIVKSKHSKSQKKTLAQPPDRALFKDHAPSKVDAQKAVLEQYLKSLCSAQLKEKGDVCEFFNSNIVINKRSSPSNRPGFMQGYLTKKGRNFGGWQTRYYVLDGPVLEYFDSRGGTKLGFLGITGEQIGRQQQQRMHKEKEGKVDHILCAETDKERDAWVEALTCYVSGCFVSAEGTMSTSKSSNQTPTGITSSPALNGCFRRQTSLDGFNRSETSLFNPQHQSSTSQDMGGETKTKIRASGMPKSNSSNQATVSTKSDLQAPLSKAPIAKEQALPMRGSTPKERPLKKELLNVAPETRDQFSRAESSFANYRDNLNRQKLLEDWGNQLGNPANNGPTTPCPVQARLLQQAQSSPQQDQTTSDAESALNSSIDCPHTPDPQRPKILGPINGAPITGGYRLKPVEEKRAKFRSAFWGFGGRNAGSGELIFWA
ncbi:hypothetical protein PPACK8108_LOCUS7223 [Phakopsora pachyrhizi]|uniref:PH domain-containing protein n=1 Tax=Phakopsora pachyrhizi TaxID=170000 RepID=A0AAV0ASG0_PHAPC|nr:hypothetical protein PPACK8108_LOCUS7223 [Phakopsora pachyrhizi]